MTHKIIDLDNCISNDEHRMHLINHDLADPYFHYHAACVADGLGNVALLSSNKKSVIVTGRSIEFLEDTLYWLYLHHVPFSGLFMRPMGDTRCSTILKPALVMKAVRKLGIKDLNACVAYDDREDVVQAYFKIGLKAHVKFINKRTKHGQP